MNTLLHFLISFIIIDIIFGNAKGYILPIILFSMLIDLDHLPYLINVKKNVFKRKFGAESRSFLHELLGLSIFSSIICILFFFLSLRLLQIISLCLLLHFSLDFLFGITRPLYPFTNKKIYLGIVKKEFVYILETFLTFILLILFLVFFYG
jgi:hypothetical protein